MPQLSPSECSWNGRMSSITLTELLHARKAMRGLAYGLHSFPVRAIDGPVALLEVFSYDTCATRSHEHVERGTTAPGDEVIFSAPDRTRPLVVCSGGLRIAPLICVRTGYGLPAPQRARPRWWGNNPK